VVYGVYVGSTRFEGKLVFSSMRLWECVKEAKAKDYRKWVWVQAIA
jgi:hypothetical protein